MTDHTLKIAPSILSANFACLGQEIAAVIKGGADYLHVDVMDGHFVPNLTIGPPVMASLKKWLKQPQAGTLPFDVHLMIDPPVDPRWIDGYLEAGLDGADCITVHVEAIRHLDRVLNYIRDRGVRAGVALNPATPIDSLQQVLHLIDQVLVMTVNPGFSGQPFIPTVVAKIAALRRQIDQQSRSIEIAVDGGITLDNIAAVTQAGATLIVSGSTIFSPDFSPDFSPEKADYGPIIRDLRRRAISDRP
ncbi:MAG: ribulose-phosphate 3-epimerase [Magnetococcales bacterium]|nr:ribulose-phosphate 3-epimerase [Magnetococcales bacterium]